MKIIYDCCTDSYMAVQMNDIKWFEQELNLSENTVMYWNNYLRKVRAIAIENKPQGIIGGLGKIVEIDESLLFLMLILLHTFFLHFYAFYYVSE